MTIALQRSPVVPSVKDKVTPEEWQMRVDLAVLYRLVAKYGMTDLAATHLSARVPGPEDHFLINPYGLMFEEVTASNLVKVDLDGNVVMETEFPVNPAGFTIHSAVHMARPEIMCVAHTHTPAGMAVASIEAGLLPITQTHMMFYGDRLAYHEWEGIATNLEERERLVADLGSRYAMILRNHGLLACGPTVQSTWKVLFFLEKACKTQLEVMAAAHATGQELVIPPQEVCEHTGAQFDQLMKRENFLSSWGGHLDELDREDSSYRN